jgi:serine/threonine protein kinase
MRASAVDQDWAVRVPIGYQVGGWEVTAPIATGNFGSAYAGRRVGAAANDPAANDPAANDPATTEPAVGVAAADVAVGVAAADMAAADVALKFIAAGPLGQRQFREVRGLAEREVEFSRNAKHERLVQVFESLVVNDVNVEFNGAVVLVMERAERSLQDLLDDVGQPCPPIEAGRLLVEICEGLCYLHSCGWVHSDLKPSNILLMTDGSIRLADFGLVTRLDGTHGYGLPLGSADYTPPERWDGELSERGVRLRPSADVWALGITAYQIVTGGAFPFPGATPGARTASAQELAAGRAPLRLQHDIDKGWRDFVARCLTPEHTNRPSISDLLEDARRLAAPTPAAVPRRRLARWLAGGGAAAVVAASAGAGWAMSPREKATAGPSSPQRLEVTVYNVEDSCRDLAERLYSCSLGLALDPRQPYAAGNVSTRRAWHGDKLVAVCALYNGAKVADENAVTSTSWIQVVVDVEPTGHAWLPAVRTHDDMARFPVCPS